MKSMAELFEVGLRPLLPACDKTDIGSHRNVMVPIIFIVPYSHFKCGL
jgi:hypothetical protein